MFCLHSAVQGTGASQRVLPRLGTRWRVLGKAGLPPATSITPHPRFPYLAFLEDSGRVAVVRLADGSVLRLPGEKWGDLFWNPICPLLAVLHWDRHIWGVYDIERETWLHKDASSYAPVKVMDWSPGGHALLVFDDEGQGGMFPVATGRLLPPEALPPVPLREMRRVVYISWVLNGRGLFWKGEEGEALLYLSREKKRVIWGERWWLSWNTSTGVRLQDGSLEIWDLAHLRVAGRADLGGLPIDVLHISPDGKKIAVDVLSPRMEALYLWVLRPDGSKAFSLGSRRSPARLPGSKEAAWSPDGRFLSVTDSGVNDVVFVLDTETGEKIYVPRPPSYPGALVSSAEWSHISPARFIAMTLWDVWEDWLPGVYIFDVHQRHSWGDPEALDLLGWHPGGMHLLVSRPEGLGLMDAERQRMHILPKEADIPVGYQILVTWSRNGRRAVTLHAPSGDLIKSAWLVLWDLVLRRMLDVFPLRGVRGVLFTQVYPHGVLVRWDGRWLMLGTE